MVRPQQIQPMKKRKLKTTNRHNTFCFIFLFALIFSSCNNEKKILAKALTGDFIIESMVSNNEELVNNLTINQFSLNENNTLELPKFSDDLRRQDTLKKRSINDFTTTEGSWNFYKKEDSYYLKLTTSNSSFNGIYRFYFIDFKGRNHFKLVLENEKTKITSGKDYFYYKQNRNLVNKAVKYTHGKVIN